MKIAILVWGSLFWSPRDLAFTGEWYYDGPRLPIEFARISGGNRLTLVIKPDYPTVTTLYCTSSHQTVAIARENLRVREGTENINNIGFIDFSSMAHSVRPNNRFILEVITQWNQQRHFDAIIWSDFAPNFQDKLNLPLNATNINNFISQLVRKEKLAAQLYIKKAPAQIQTRHRKEIEETFTDEGHRDY